LPYNAAAVFVFCRLPPDTVFDAEHGKELLHIHLPLLCNRLVQLLLLLLLLQKCLLQAAT
jgi:hypothetical protein